MTIGTKLGNFSNEADKEFALQIISLIKDIRFGSVEVIIHDGRIVQIDKRERFRVHEPKNQTEASKQMSL